MIRNLLQVAALMVLVTACAGNAERASTPTPPTLTPLPISTQVPSPTPTLPGGVIEDVPYADASPEQILTLHLPEGRDPAKPVLLIARGQNQPVFLAYFTERGYPIISYDTRTTPFRMEAVLQDAFCALAWTHAHADAYYLDPDRIVAVGMSMDGSFAALLATVDTPSLYLEDCPHALPETNRMAAVVAFAGQFNYTGVSIPNTSSETKVEMSAINYIDGSEPPFLLLHGASDRETPPQQSEDFASACEEAGVEAEVVLFEGETHMGLFESEEAFEAMEAFLIRLFALPQ